MSNKEANPDEIFFELDADEGHPVASEQSENVGFDLSNLFAEPEAVDPLQQPTQQAQQPAPAPVVAPAPAQPQERQAQAQVQARQSAPLATPGLVALPPSLLDPQASPVPTSVSPTSSLISKLKDKLPDFSPYKYAGILLSISAVYLAITGICYGVDKHKKSDQEKIDDMKSLRKTAITTQLLILLIFTILCMVIAFFNLDKQNEKVFLICTGLIFISIYISMFWICGIAGWDVDRDFMEKEK